MSSRRRQTRRERRKAKASGWARVPNRPGVVAHHAYENPDAMGRPRIRGMKQLPAEPVRVVYSDGNPRNRIRWWDDDKVADIVMRTQVRG